MSIALKTAIIIYCYSKFVRPSVTLAKCAKTVTATAVVLGLLESFFWLDTIYALVSTITAISTILFERSIALLSGSVKTVAVSRNLDLFI